MAGYDTIESISALSEMDPELAEIIAGAPLPQPDYFDLKTLRPIQYGFEKSISQLGIDPAVQDRAIMIPMRDGHLNEALVYHSPDLTAKPGLVVLCHGGGFIMGTNMQTAPFARGVVLSYGAVVVCISYRLAPEHRFPAAPHDVWDNLNWLAENASCLGADTSKGFVLGGGSAGANLAAVVAQKWVRTNSSPSLTGLFVSIPYFLGEGNVPAKYRHLWVSRTQNAKAPVLDVDALHAIEEAYRPDHTSPDFSPFNDPESFSRLPRTYIQVAGLDPLRDDGLIYANTLRENGLDIRLDVYRGVPHAHNGVFPSLKQSYKTNVDTILGIGWLLGADDKAKEVEDYVFKFTASMIS